MVYTNLSPVSLPATFLNPTMRDALVYSNVRWPCSPESFLKFFNATKDTIARDEALIQHQYPRIGELLDLYVHQLIPQAIQLVDQMFTGVDPSYVPFGSHLPNVPLKVYSGMVFANKSTAEWADILETLVFKFPDFANLLNREITIVSLKVLDIFDKGEIYYRRAEFLAANQKISEETEQGSIIGLQAARMRHARLAPTYRSNLLETAPFLDTIDGIASYDAGHGITSAFDWSRDIT